MHTCCMFQVTLSRAILPLDHYASMRGRLADAAAAVAQGSLKEAAEMVDRWVGGHNILLSSHDSMIFMTHDSSYHHTIMVS
jgi:hypothetical protein